MQSGLELERERGGLIVKESILSCKSFSVYACTNRIDVLIDYNSLLCLARDVFNPLRGVRPYIRCRD